MPLCRRHTSDSRNYGDGPPFNRSDSDDESDDSRSYGDDPQHDESDSAEDDPSSEFGRCKYCDAIVLIEEFGKHKAEKCPGVRPDSDFRTSIDTVDQTCQKCEKSFSRKTISSAMWPQSVDRASMNILAASATNRTTERTISNGTLLRYMTVTLWT